MSRRAFRIDVAEPRPASAWALVTVASITLWITQQLAPWAIAIQVVLLLYTLSMRTRPRAWQRSDIVLNVGMFFIVGVTIRVALAGGPSTVALAHFAALTQVLQLVDARPRRTEFLLVALALFQVVLASNLTDSVFFPPLLVIFVVATVWTLLVHTLRSEALEAGEPHQAASRALTPGLIRMTFFATGASIALALLLFVLLPRLGSRVVSGSSLAHVVATAGFSDTVTLGDLGSIRQDPTVVIRAYTVSGARPPLDEAYWRGLAFDHFDGASWSITPTGRSAVPGSAEGGVSFGAHPGQFNLVQVIMREPVETGVLFGVGDKRLLQGAIRRLETDVNGGLYSAGQAFDRVRYTISTERTEWRDPALRRDHVVPPRLDRGRHTQLPEFSPAVEALALEITRGIENDAEAVRALETYLLRNGKYSDTPPALDPSTSVSPLEQFLFGDMAAHCEYYASALVVLARSLGFPARLVNGFAGGRRNRIGDFVEVTRSDAHAWAEVHYERAGWVRYDATPALLRSRAEAQLSLNERIRELTSAMELWWFQRVVGFDRSDQVHAVKSAWLAWKARQPRRHEVASSSAFSKWQISAGGPSREISLILLAIAAALVVRRLKRRTRAAGLPRAYSQALTLFARQGVHRDPGTTAREFAATIAGSFPDAGPVFAELTESYLGERFGGRPESQGAARVAELRRMLRRRGASARVRHAR